LNIADTGASVRLAEGFVRLLSHEVGSGPAAGQTTGRRFENAVRDYLSSLLESSADRLAGTWSVECNRSIADFAQYGHLRILERLAADRREVRIALGGEYVVKPDVVVSRSRLADADFNASRSVVDTISAQRALLRTAQIPLLHASISCKLTIRSDRSQNSRLEALNLIRSRRGRVPHIVVVTAEPLPSRIESIALGTGDFDCIYHIALPELLEATRAAVRENTERPPSGRRPNRADLAVERQLEKLELMIDGQRLRDISDLPLDLLL